MTAASGSGRDKSALNGDEREFLQRSLDDLDREREAGDLDEQNFARLSRHYRRRLSALDTPKVASSATRSRRGVWWIAASIVLAVGIGVGVARSAGQRLATDTLSKGKASGTRQLLAEARSALGTDRPVAAARFAEVLETDVNNVEALTYLAWIRRLDAKALVDNGTTTAAEQRSVFEAADNQLERAASIDRTVADPRCFQAVVRFRDLGDANRARSSYVQCVGTNPTQQVLVLVEKLGPEIDTALAASADPVQSKLASARLTRDSEPNDALATYRAVLVLDPTNVEARTWMAWITAKAAGELVDRKAISEAEADLVLDKQLEALLKVRATAPNDGDAACVYVLIATARSRAGDSTGSEARSVCRSEVADRSLRDLVLAAG
jgi:tetratricopeptide (TPR) repeat protein